MKLQRHLSPLVALLLAGTPLPGIHTALAQGGAQSQAVTQFDYAHKILKLADIARDSGDQARAIILYGEARGEYATLLSKYPAWQPGITTFQIKYCEEQLVALGQTMPDILAGVIKTNAPAVSNRPLPPAMPATSTPPPTMLPASAPSDPSPNTTSTPRTENPEILKQLARTHIRDGNAAAARTILLDAMKLAPDDRGVRKLMALAQCQAENFDDAIFLLDILIEEDETDTEALLLRATAAVGMGENTEAIEDLRNVIKRDPKSAEAHYNLARLLMSTDPRQAREHYDTARRNGGDRDPEMEALLAK